MTGVFSFRKLAVVLLVLVMVVSTFGSVSAQHRRRYRSHKHSTTKGALIGGGAGLLGGALFGGGKGALIGAGAGAATGYLIQRHRNHHRHRHYRHR